MVHDEKIPSPQITSYLQQSFEKYKQSMCDSVIASNIHSKYCVYYHKLKEGYCTSQCLLVLSLLVLLVQNVLECFDAFFFYLVCSSLHFFLFSSFWLVAHCSCLHTFLFCPYVKTTFYLFNMFSRLSKTVTRNQLIKNQLYVNELYKYTWITWANLYVVAYVVALK